MSFPRSLSPSGIGERESSFMVCRLIDDKEQWNKFMAGQSHAQFLQSWQWGEFQKTFGRRVWRVLCHSEQSEESFGVAQFFEHYLGLGMGYLYCPRGPIWYDIATPQMRGKQSHAFLTDFMEFIKKDIVNYGHVFFRVEPLICHPERSEGSLEHAKLNRDSSCLPAGRRLCLRMTVERVPSIQPTHTLLLDLNKSEEQLLAEMRQKTRYNIRLAEKKGLEFTQGDQQKFDIFWRLLQETARRDKIKLHPKKYYQLMLKIFGCELFVVNYKNKMLAGGIFMGFGDTFTYVHGASANEHRDLMAPYFLHWRAMQFAKQVGYRYYDFGGVNPDNANDFDFRASWAGITRFKRGFGGDIFSFGGAYEIPFKPRAYKLFQQVKKCLHRSMDRTQDSGSCNRGSTPLGGKN